MRGKRTVWLVGMMGAGKSTVGPILARRLGCRFVDTDAEIERAAGCSIAEIFAAEGEEVFRARERAEVASHLGEEAVVALGGGALATPGVCAAVDGSGTRVYLRARSETLLGRLGDCRGRPLLREVAPEERLARLRALLERRRADYESAKVIVDTDGVPADRVAEAVAGKLAEGARPGAGRAAGGDGT